MALLGSTTNDRNTVVTREKGIRGDAGTDGTDGAGFDTIRESLLDNPMVKLLAPNYPAEVGFDKMFWIRDSDGRGFNKYGQLASAGPDVPREENEGWLIEGAATNLFLNSDSLSTQGVTTGSQEYTVSFFGTGTIAFSGSYTGSLVGTGANDRVSLTFTATTGTLTCTVSGTVDYAQIETGDFASSYITSEGTQGERAADNVYLPAFNNVPKLSNDFSVLFKVYFDGFTGGDDYIFDMPDGASCFCNSGTLTFRLTDGVSPVTATHTIVAGTQYDVILLKSSSDIKLYVDGVLEATTAHALTPTNDTSDFLTIGRDLAGVTNNMNGNLRDFFIYDSLLNSSEVRFMAGV